MDNFTPASDKIIKELGGTSALVYGMVWRFCQMDKRACTASLQTIAKRLNMSPRTVRRHLKILCKTGYIVDTTPNIRYKPHVYITTRSA